MYARSEIVCKCRCAATRPLAPLQRRRGGLVHRKLTITLAAGVLAGMLARPSVVTAQTLDTAGTDTTGRVEGVSPETTQVQIVTPKIITPKIVSPPTTKAQPVETDSAPATVVPRDTTPSAPIKIAGQPQRQRRLRIEGALRALYEAREDLQNAAQQFGSHRVNAIRAVDAAIAQLALALEYDRTHRDTTRR